MLNNLNEKTIKTLSRYSKDWNECIAEKDFRLAIQAECHITTYLTALEDCGIITADEYKSLYKQYCKY